MNIIYKDNAVVVAIKPPRVLSVDEPGGMPSLLRDALGTDFSELRTVHRLDMVVSGLMVFAVGKENAAKLSESIRNDDAVKDYFAVVHGDTPESGTMRDLLLRDKKERRTYVAVSPAKGVQEAILEYRTLGRYNGLSLVRVHLITGRTHQIRCQFSSRAFPIVNDRKYCLPQYRDDLSEYPEIALFSCALSFPHPVTGKKMDFTANPPDIYPWNCFKEIINNKEQP